jgi:asparagine synthase (glutamine-hydrolysing)
LVPGGSLWAFEHGNCRKEKYFSPASWESQSVLSGEEFSGQFEETFARVLPRYFESQSRIGISLTGGLDSRMIMACRPREQQNAVCYTFSGERAKTLDDRLAARVAKACGLEHQLLRIGADFFSDFAKHADRTVFVTDGCFGVTGAHEIYLNKQGRRLAPVRLTGNYGSEILRGTSTFKPLNLSTELIEPHFQLSSNDWADRLTRSHSHPVTFAAFHELPWKLFGSLCASRSQTIFRTPYLDNDLVALAYRCPDDLRRSPRPALRLIGNNDMALQDIPTDMGFGKTGTAAALRHAFSWATFKLDYLNNEGFPDWLMPLDPLLGCIGFGIGIFGLHKYLHYRTWFREKLAGYLHDAVADVRTQRSPIWKPASLKKMVADHTGGHRNYVLEINAVLTIEAVERLLFRNSVGNGESENTEIPAVISASAIP